MADESKIGESDDATNDDASSISSSSVISDADESTDDRTMPFLLSSILNTNTEEGQVEEGSEGCEKDGVRSVRFSSEVLQDSVTDQSASPILPSREEGEMVEKLNPKIIQSHEQSAYSAQDRAFLNQSLASRCMFSGLKRNEKGEEWHRVGGGVFWPLWISVLPVKDGGKWTGERRVSMVKQEGTENIVMSEDILPTNSSKKPRVTNTHIENFGECFVQRTRGVVHCSPEEFISSVFNPLSKFHLSLNKDRQPSPAFPLPSYVLRNLHSVLVYKVAERNYPLKPRCYYTRCCWKKINANSYVMVFDDESVVGDPERRKLNISTRTDLIRGREEGSIVLNRLPHGCTEVTAYGRVKSSSTKSLGYCLSMVQEVYAYYEREDEVDELHRQALKREFENPDVNAVVEDNDKAIQHTLLKLVSKLQKRKAGHSFWLSSCYLFWFC